MDARPHSDPPPISVALKADVDIRALCNVAGRKASEAIADRRDNPALWREYAYFNEKDTLSGKPIEGFRLSYGSFVSDALIAMSKRGYEVSLADQPAMHRHLMALDASSPLMRITQDVAALSLFLKNAPPQHAGRYEAALEIRAAQLAQMCEIAHNDPQAQLNLLGVSGQHFRAESIGPRR